MKPDELDTIIDMILGMLRDRAEDVDGGRHINIHSDAVEYFIRDAIERILMPVLTERDARIATLEQDVARFSTLADERHDRLAAANRARDDARSDLVKLRERVAALTRERDDERRAHERTIDQRDNAEEWADKLAYAIGTIEEIGEHSSSNNPWREALDIFDAKWQARDAAPGSGGE